MKNQLRNIIILIMLTFLIIYFVLKDDFDEIMVILSNINYFYLIITIIILYISNFFRSLSLYYLIKKEKKDYSYKKAYKLNIISHFFNGITPFSSGGQPFQIYYLNKNEKMQISKGIGITFYNFFLYQTALVIISLILLLLNSYFKFLNLNLFLNKLILIGFLINFLIFLVLLIICFEKNKKEIVINKILLFLNKIKLLKEENLKLIMDNVNGFSNQIKKINSDKKILIKGIISNFLTLFFFIFIPYFVFKMLNIEQINILKILIANSFTLMVSSFVPIPGGTLGFEFGFLTFFGFFIKGPILKIGMLVFRTITYYFMIFYGALLFFSKKKEG